MVLFIPQASFVALAMLAIVVAEPPPPRRQGGFAPPTKTGYNYNKPPTKVSPPPRDSYLPPVSATPSKPAPSYGPPTVTKPTTNDVSLKFILIFFVNISKDLLVFNINLLITNEKIALKFVVYVA